MRNKWRDKWRSLIKTIRANVTCVSITFETSLLRECRILFEICIPDGYSYAFQIANAKGKRKKMGYKIWVDKWWNGGWMGANE